MKSNYHSNSVAKSYLTKQSHNIKLNKQNLSLIDHKDMIVKSLPKNSQSPPNKSFNNAVNHIIKLIQFLNTAKINPEVQIALVASLKTYMVQVKQSLKEKIIVLKPNQINRNSISKLSLNSKMTEVESPQLKKLNSQKYPYQNNIKISNFSNIVTKGTKSGKLTKQILKAPYPNKGFLPQITSKSQEISSLSNKQNPNDILGEKLDNKVGQKIINGNDSDSQMKQYKGQVYKKKIRVQTEVQEEQKRLIENKSFQMLDSTKLVEKLKDKIRNHEVLIQKLKEKLAQFEKNQNDQKHQNKIIDKKESIQKQQRSQQDETQKCEAQKANNNRQTNDYQEEIQLLKQQLKARQHEITNLWITMQSYK